ncbi:MAG: ATP-binding protein, partial [Thermodesulfobacteriota bacterium]
DIAATAAQFTLSGSAVGCTMDFPPDLWPVTVDRGQMEQVFSNLVLNAREAMPRGGSLKLTGENVQFQKSRSATLRPGRYVKIAVEDDGTGIPSDYLSRIFDPYFTTKGLGERKGTGLGL